MSELWRSFIGSLVRWLLAGIAGYAVRQGIITEQMSIELVAAIAVGAAGLIWSLWNKYKGRLRFLKALEMPPGADEADVERAVKLDPPKVT
jgi:hypothetical protein